MTRMLPAALEKRLQPRHGPLHIAARVEQIDELLERATLHLEPLRAQAQDGEAERREAPWLPPLLAARMAAAQAESVATVEALCARLAGLRDGFASMPVDEALASPAPMPVRWDDAEAA